MIRQVTFGFVISMMSSCVNFRALKKETRSVLFMKRLQHDLQLTFLFTHQKSICIIRQIIFSKTAYHSSTAVASVSVLKDMLLFRVAKDQCFMTRDEIETINQAVCIELCSFALTFCAMVCVSIVCQIVCSPLFLYAPCVVYDFYNNNNNSLCK